MFLTPVLCRSSNADGIPVNIHWILRWSPCAKEYMHICDKNVSNRAEHMLQWTTAIKKCRIITRLLLPG